MWKLGSNIILSIHLAFTLFIVLTPVLVLIGGLNSWEWVRFPLYRNIHMAFLGFVAFEVLFAKPCPLMVWENFFRFRAHMPMYTTGFFDYWVKQLLNTHLKKWMFNAVFLVIFILSMLAYFLVQPY